MTNSAMAFLGQSQRPPKTFPPPAPQHDYPVGAEEEEMDIQSDLVPSANTFIRKLYQMVTSENHDIISFTDGTCLGVWPWWLLGGEWGARRTSSSSSVP